MKDIDDIVMRYEESLRLGKAGLSAGQVIREQVERYRRTVGHGQEVSRQVCRILDEERAYPGLYLYYVAFGNKLDRLKRTRSSETLALEAQVQPMLWIFRGLSIAVLERIRNEIFEIIPPAGP
ncbi:MAG: hypothetical protein JSU73_02070 [candidate division WOR-3 bacterium]|nr:MAG: hypothetical protein JSU73_02070 [candidate division WOR-3 bacterium]